MFLAAINVKTMKMRYCNCGHEPALHIRDGKVTELDKGGLVLGVMDDSEYEIGVVNLLEEDIILMYTDGLIDSVNFESEMWGRDRMLKALDKCHLCCAENLIRNLLGFRRRFVGLAPQTDDTSIVAIKMDSSAQPQDQNVTVDEDAK
jgi:sigma-B regulation protein RsbU (phosphoserine phosphatase)